MIPESFKVPHTFTLLGEGRPCASSLEEWLEFSAPSEPFRIELVQSSNEVLWHAFLIDRSEMHNAAMGVRASGSGKSRVGAVRALRLAAYATMTTEEWRLSCLSTAFDRAIWEVYEPDRLLARAMAAKGEDIAWSCYEKLLGRLAA